MPSYIVTFFTEKSNTFDEFLLHPISKFSIINLIYGNFKRRYISREGSRRNAKKEFTIEHIEDPPQEDRDHKRKMIPSPLRGEG